MNAPAVSAAPAVPAAPATMLVVLLIALAGCAESASPNNDTANPSGVDSNTPNDTATNATDVVQVIVTYDRVVVQGPSVTLTGRVDRPATVSVLYGQDLGDSFDADGPWNYTYAPPYGHDTVTVTADDGKTTGSTTVLVVRNKQLTVEVDYDPASGRTDTTHTFWWDFGGLRSLYEDGSYHGCAQPHPGRPNAHDALLDFEDASGIDIGFTPCGQFGVNTETIDGYASPGAWCFQVNGETAEFGVSLLELEDGDVFRFVDCVVAFPA